MNRSPRGHGKPFKFQRAHDVLVVLSRRGEKEAGISFQTRLRAKLVL